MPNGGESLKMIFAGFILATCLLHYSSADVDCDLVMSDPPSYPITWINECTQREQMSDLVLSDEPQHECGPFTCTNTCVLGWAKDEFGCDTCSCLPAEEEEEGVFEGDITVVGEMIDYIKSSYDNPDRVIDPNVLRDATRSLPLWKMYKSGNNYIVPYVVTSGIGQQGRAAIQAAAASFAQHSCIRLQPRGSQGKYISFYRGGGCSSPVGAVSRGAQRVSLAAGCWQKGTAMHEIMHSLGFWHEQSRPDRDRYVRINTQNIQRGMAYNFNRKSTSEVDSMGSAYDTNSVLHYNSYAFSANNRPTITDRAGNAIKTQRYGLSKSDIWQLNKLYGCSTGGTGTGGTGTSGSCTDSHRSCSYWAGKGECSKNSAYMKTNCCNSCKTVSPTSRPTTTRRPTTRRTTTQAPSRCVDSHRSCRYWTRTNECTKNPNYMLKSCCASCRGSARSSCRDLSSNCASWTRSGYCQSSYYATYMVKNCKKSCGRC